MKLLTLTKNFRFATNFYSIANFDSELEELRQTVRRFADEKVAPLAHEADVKDKFPMHLWREVGEMGLLGSTTPAKYGGSELNYTAHTMIMEELSRASGSIALSYGAHSALCLAQITRHGTE